MFAGLLLSHLRQDRKARREYWQRAFNPRRMGAGWFLISIFAYPLISLLTLLPDISAGIMPFSDIMQLMLLQPVRFIPFLAIIFLFGPFPEELGWRGYALDRLQQRWNALISSLILGIFWAAWHVPLFFMNGTFQNEIGFATAGSWRFCISIVIMSVFFTWIFNNTRRSTLSAILLHFSINLTGNLLEFTAMQENIRIILLVVLTVIVVRVYGYKKLSRIDDNTDQFCL